MQAGAIPLEYLTLRWARLSNPNTWLTSRPSGATPANCICQIQKCSPEISGSYSIPPTDEVGIPIKDIGASAFANRRNLTSITIPDSVTNIGSGAFYYCSGLTSVTIPDSVTSIGSGAFNMCRGLISVNLFNSLQSIEQAVFANCDNLISIRIPDSVINIVFAAFAECFNLTSVTIGNSVTSIGDYAFIGCSNLTSITIPDSVTNIGNKSFGYRNLQTDETIEGFTIYGYANTAAEAYAETNSLIFIVLVYNPVKQRDYIHIYDGGETNFTHNGIRILTPLSCTITETLNEGYELELVHPRDEMAAWYELQEFRIIRARGQLFRIYKLVKSMSGDSVTVYARHIWYDLGCNYLEDVRPTDKSGQESIDWILERTFQAHKFTGTSDIDEISTAYYQNMSPVKAFLGADQAFIARWGGELTRDNFTFSINKRRGQDNVFRCTYGIDMTDIVETVDYSEYCTVLLAFDSFGNRRRIFTGSPNPAELEYVKGVVFTYQEEDVQQFYRDADTYLDNVRNPMINYTIAFANLKNSDKYKDFIGLQRCDLGDTGYISNTRLGISNLQKIIKKTVDAITGDVISVELGNVKRTITRPQRIEVFSPQSPLVAVNNSLNQKIHDAQVKSIVSHNDMRKYTHQELSKFTHKELGTGG